MDAIVFNQDELLKAETSSYICICDNEYTIPTNDNTSYFALGEVTSQINLSKIECIQKGIIFLNFTPKYLKKDLPIYANIPLKWSGSQNNNIYNSYTSYSSFQNSSYFFLRNINSYMYEYKTSFRSSYTNSYMINSSFTTSYTLTGSYKTFIHTSFLSSFKLGDHLAKMISSFSKNINEEYIPVNGYGINLI